MRLPSQPRRPQLERFLLDEDTTPDLENILRLLGFRTEHARRVEEDLTDDVEVLRWARKHHRILVCHDQHDDHATKLAWNPEIGTRGGRVIEIRGGPEQDPQRAAGLVLTHRSEWSALFAEHGAGVARLRLGSVDFLTRAQLVDRIPTPRSERDYEILMEAAGVRRTRPVTGRPGRGGRRRFPQQTGKRLIADRESDAPPA